MGDIVTPVIEPGLMLPAPALDGLCPFRPLLWGLRLLRLRWDATLPGPGASRPPLRDPCACGDSAASTTPESSIVMLPRLGSITTAGRYT